MVTSPRDLAEAAWDDFASTGRVTDAVARLLLQVTSMVARFGTTQPPGEHDQWTTEAVEDAAGGFLTDDGTPRRLTTLRSRSHGPRSFRLQLEAAVRNWVIDQARTTNMAHVIQRIRDVMESKPDRFRPDNAAGVRAWTLEGHGDDLFSGRHGDLVDVAQAVDDLQRIYWDSERRDPIATADDLARLLEVILEAADAPVEERLLAEVVADRFCVNAGPDSTPIAPESTTWKAPLHRQPSEDADVDLAAEDLFARLDDRTRTVLALADRHVTEIGQVLGLSSESQAYGVRKQAVDVLKTLLGDDPDGQEIAGRLSDIAWEWLEDRSRQPRSSSNTHWSRSDS